ncbi:MAG: HIT domain-containing protein [Nitrospirae bacterium]|nr:HIT domain-containing protein [Nitrospirota bacterium]
MKRIWAPWRMKYILKKDKEQTCLFCRKPKENRDEENYLLVRGETSFLMLNTYPYSNGHLLVVPYKHVSRLDNLEGRELLELMMLTRKATELLEKVIQPQGFNIGMNLGKVAGAGIADHLHLHIVPRWEGDTNFMPVVSETKVIPEHLETTYQKLKKTIELHKNTK